MASESKIHNALVECLKNNEAFDTFDEMNKKGNVEFNGPAYRAALADSIDLILDSKEKIWDALAKNVQDWINEALGCLNSEKDVVDFSDWVEVSPPVVKRTSRKTAQKEPVAEVTNIINQDAVDVFASLSDEDLTDWVTNKLMPILVTMGVSFTEKEITKVVDKTISNTTKKSIKSDKQIAKFTAAKEDVVCEILCEDHTLSFEDMFEQIDFKINERIAKRKYNTTLRVLTQLNNIGKLI